VSVTGVLLVGGASRRFGSPKALARFGGESLAERAYRILGAAFPEVLAVGKTADRLPLPFPVLDDGSETRAALVGLVAGVRAAGNDLAVVLPTDMPWVTAPLLRELARAADGVEAAVPQTGPLPGAFRKTALPVLERRLRAGELSLRDAVAELDSRVVTLDASLLGNVNTPRDLA
jgi:molybdopterin-guanine dinucleotide biosynthesis protein A